jgi:hypothetical protein
MYGKEANLRVESAVPTPVKALTVPLQFSETLRSTTFKPSVRSFRAPS